MKKKMDWVIHMVGNGIVCSDCGKVESSFPEYIGNFHTHGLDKYGHQELQLVIHMTPENIGYVLNTLGLRIQAGEKFEAGQLAEGIFLDCPVRLDEFVETGRKALRVIIPDEKNRFPEDPACSYPYNYQLVPTDQLEKRGGPVS